MTLKELFDNNNFRGCVTLQMVERGVVYQTGDGFGEVTERNCDGHLPVAFLPYASDEVGKIYASHAWFAKDVQDDDGKFRAESVDSISIQVYETPSDDICEFYNTGGNIYCGCCKVDDGWFMGEESSWGGIWKTYSQAWEAFIEEDCGYVRDVNDFDELKRIWTRIYTENNYCELLKTLEEDLANNPDVTKKNS